MMIMMVMMMNNRMSPTRSTGRIANSQLKTFHECERERERERVQRKRNEKKKKEIHLHTCVVKVLEATINRVVSACRHT
jgi:hypothetical protein